MKNAFQLPEAINWHEGMLLSPQHFQQTSMRNQELLHYHLMNLSPFYWGVRKLKVDPTLLVSGIFRVIELEAIMPDGLVVCYPKDHTQTTDLEVDLTPYAEEGQQEDIEVHLAIPAVIEGASPKGSLKRYNSIEGNEIQDENTGENPVQIPRLRPRLSLIVSKNPAQKYITIPLARLQYANALFSLTDYIPPTFEVKETSPLWEMCKQITNKLREKAVFLTEKIKNSSAIGGTPAAMETGEKIRNLVSTLPQLEMVLNTDGIHPYFLYYTLSSVVGTLSALDPGMIPPKLPKYDQNNLREVFREGQQYVLRVIEQGIIEEYNTIAFSLNDKNAFSLNLLEDWLSDKLIIGIAATPGMREKEVVEWLDKCLIASESKIDFLRSHRMRGSERKNIEGDEKLIPMAGTILFQVAIDPELIVANEKLAIVPASDNQGDLKPSGISLFVKNEQSEEF